MRNCCGRLESMCVSQWRWLRVWGLRPKNRTREWGGLLATGQKMQGAPKKTSGRSYSLERPVARHFVCFSILQASCRPQTLENKGCGISPYGRNCHAGRKDLLRLARGKNATRTIVEKYSKVLQLFTYHAAPGAGFGTDSRRAERAFSAENHSPQRARMQGYFRANESSA